MRNIYRDQYHVFLTSLVVFIIASSSLSAQEIDGTLRRIPVPILMYHYVSPLPTGADQIRINLTISPQTFRNHMQYLEEQAFSIVSLYEINKALMTGEALPPNPIALTFDDGYIDHYTYVFPILKEYEYTATFFIITDFADNQNPNHMNWSQIKEMAVAGMDIESHTKSHQELNERNHDFLVFQILGSLQTLEAHLGETPGMFSYPVGRYDDNTIDVLETTPILRAVTTESGAHHTSDNFFELPRLRITGGMGVYGLDYILNNALQK